MIATGRIGQIAVAADREAKSINKWAEETLAKAAAG